jgi:hypothetical protein
VTHSGGGSGLVVCAVFKTAGRRQWWLRWVRFPHAPANSGGNGKRRIGSRRLQARFTIPFSPFPFPLFLVTSLLLSAPRYLVGQIPFPTPSGRQDTSRTDTVKVPAFRFPPPTPPLAAMARSMLIPGWGQAVLGRRVTGAAFVFWEGVTITMTYKASHQLRLYRRTATDKVPAKKQEVQDWIVLLVFNHLFAGAEAFVAAQLWDFPAEAQIQALPGGFGVGFRLRL